MESNCNSNKRGKKNDCLHFRFKQTQHNTWERIHVESRVLNATRSDVTAPTMSAPVIQTRFSAVTAGIIRVNTATQTS